MAPPGGESSRAAGCEPPDASLASADLTETNRLISAFFELILVLLRLYTWAIILAAVFSTLSAFGVLDTRNRLVWTVGDFFYRITEPGLRPIRRIMPNFGNVDISPIILLLLIQFVAVPLVVSLRNGILYGSWQFLVS